MVSTFFDVAFRFLLSFPRVSGSFRLSDCLYEWGTGVYVAVIECVTVAAGLWVRLLTGIFPPRLDRDLLRLVDHLSSRPVCFRVWRILA